MKCSFLILFVAIILCPQRGQGRPAPGGSELSLISNIVAKYARTLFKIRDRNHDGLITESDLRFDFSEKEVEIITEEVDADDNGSIDMEEMKALLIRPVTERPRRVRHFLRL